MLKGSEPKALLPGSNSGGIVPRKAGIVNTQAKTDIVGRNATDIDKKEGKYLGTTDPDTAGGPETRKGGTFTDFGSTAKAKPLNNTNFFSKAVNDGVDANTGEYLSKSARIDAFKAGKVERNSSSTPSISPDSGADVVAAVTKNTEAIMRMVDATKTQTTNDSNLAKEQIQAQETMMSRSAAKAEENALEQGSDLSGFMTPENFAKKQKQEGKKETGSKLKELIRGPNPFKQDGCCMGGGGGGIEMPLGRGRRSPRARGGALAVGGGRGGVGGMLRRGGGKRALTRGAAMVGGKAAAKGVAKGLGKAGLKKIPGVGAVAGAAFAAERAMKGDWLGAGGELLSGLAGTIPGVGTAVSAGIDAGLMARDAGLTPFARGGIITQPTKGIVGEAGKEGVFPLEGKRGRDTFQAMGEGILEAQKKGKKEFAELQSLGLKQYFEAKGGFKLFGDLFGNIMSTIFGPIIGGLAKGLSRIVTGGLNKLFDTGGGPDGDVDAPDLKTKIRQLESGNDYSSMYSRDRGDFSRGKEDITKMTIDQVDDLQTDYLNHQASKGYGESQRSAAMGAYQMMEVRKVAKILGIDTSKTKFDKATQDKMSEYYLNVAGYQKWKKGEITDAQFNDGLAVQFASVKKSTGGGQYDGDGMNSAYGDVMPLLKKLKKEASDPKPDPKPDPVGNLDDIPYTQEESNALLAAGTPEKYAEVMAKIKKRQAEALKAKQSNVGVPNSAPEISESYGVDQGKSFNFSIPGKGNYEAYKTATGFEIFRHGGLGALVGAKTRIDTKDGANSWAVAALMKAGKARQEAAKVTPPPKTDQAAAVAPASKPSIAASSASPQTGTPIMVTSAQVASASTASAGAAPTIINNYYGGGQQQGGVNGNGVVAGIDMNAAGLSAFQDLKIRTIS